MRLRSLETLHLRMEKQAVTALETARFLNNHPKVKKVYYLGVIPKGTQEYDLFIRQHRSNGAMISFDIEGGRDEAFRFLNALKLVKLAVSLGGTESLIEHPATMTHVGLSDELKLESSVSDSMIRLSVGVENVIDILWDFEQAFNCV